MRHNMVIRMVNEWDWDDIQVSMEDAPEGSIIMTEKSDGYYIMATCADNLDNTITAVMEALDDNDVKVFNHYMKAWLHDLHMENGEGTFEWLDSGIDDCLRGKWRRSWEIEYNDNGEWTIFLAVAK